MAQFTCAHCGVEFDGRKRKYCTPKCCKDANRCSNKPCTVCARQAIARGLCTTHYSQQRTNRHPKTTVTCDACGSSYERESRTKQRYEHNYCSTFCKQYGRYGAQSSELPATHWARMYGATCEWVPPQPQPITFTCAYCRECGNPYTWAGGAQPHAQYCGRACAKRVARRTRRAREHNAPGTFSYTDIMRQYLKQGKVCAYCHQPITGLPDPEHVVPLSRGGRNDMSNLVAACRSCNVDKRDLTLDEWAADRARRGLHTMHHLVGSAYMHVA